MQDDKSANVNTDQIQTQYDDDDPIEFLNKSITQQEINMKKLATYDIKNSVSITCKYFSNQIINDQKQAKGPCIISIEAKDCDDDIDQDDKRTPIDLICVIDKSGSMCGQKIKLVRETLEFIVDCLNENDRVSIITFNTQAERLIPLTRAKNKQDLIEKIKKIESSGRTNIDDGLNLAFKTLSERKNKNPVSSILLLSDGRDDNKEVSKRINESLDKQNITDTFSLHAFGFGSDQDENEMNGIANIKSGQFYYIEELESIAESFACCLGGLYSIAVQNVQLTIKPHEGIIINEILAADQLLDKTKENTIKLSQLLLGTKKDFVFSVTIDLENNVNNKEHNYLPIVNYDCNMESISNEKFRQNNDLSVKIMSQTAKHDLVKNVEVLKNQYRVIASKVMSLASDLSQKGQYDKAKTAIESIVDEIKQNFAANIDEEMELLLNDLNDVKNHCTEEYWTYYGSKKSHSYSRSYMRQEGTSKRINMYTNKRQKMHIMSSHANVNIRQDKIIQPPIVDEKIQKIKTILNNDEYFDNLTNNTFSNLDFDNSGQLKPGDVKYLISQYSPNTNIDELISQYDKNNDGKLNTAEFKNLFRSSLKLSIGLESGFTCQYDINCKINSHTDYCGFQKQALTIQPKNISEDLSKVQLTNLFTTASEGLKKFIKDENVSNNFVDELFTLFNSSNNDEIQVDEAKILFKKLSDDIQTVNTDTISKKDFIKILKKITINLL